MPHAVRRARLLDLGETSAVRSQSVYHAITATLGPEDDPALDGYVESAVKYAGYIDRQVRDVASTRRLDRRGIPADFSYASIGGLSSEAREKLETRRPETVGQASRIAGVRASDLSILLVHLERHRDSSGSATG